MAKPSQSPGRGKGQRRQGQYGRPPVKGQPSKGQSRTGGPQGKASGQASSVDVLDKALYWILLGLVFFLPMIFAQISYDQFDIIKVVILRATTLVMLALWVWRALLARQLDLRRSPMDWVILAFLGWVLVSSLLSIHPPTAFFGKYRRYEGFLSLLSYATLFFLTTQIVTGIGQVRAIIRTALVSAGIISLYGVMQALGWDFLQWGSLPFDVNRAFSSFGNPDLLAGYVALMMPIGLMSFVSQESSAQDEYLAIGLAVIIGLSTAIGFAALHLKWAPIILQLARAVFALVTLIGLVLPWVMRLFDPRQREGHFVTLYAVSSLAVGLAALTAFSRSAWVAGGVSLVVLPIMFWRHGLLSNRKVITLAVIIVLIVGTLGVATTRSSSAVINLFSRVQSIFKFNEGSAASRFSIWRSGLAAAKDRPIFGFGPETYRLIFPKYKEVKYVQMVGRLSVADNAHNYPIQLSATLGIPGMLLFYAVMLGGIFFGWKAAWGKGAHSTDRALMGGLVVALLAYQVHLFFGISITGSTFLAWVVMAMALLPLARTVQFKWRDNSETVRTAIVGVTVIACAALFVFNLQYFRADQYYLRSYQYANFNIDEAITNAKKAVALDPYNDMYQGQIGLLMSQKARQTAQPADGQAAIDAINASIRFNPYEFDNYIFLANAYAILAEKDPAEWNRVLATADKALEIEPVAPAARFYKGLAYLSMNRPKDAVRELAIGAYQDPSYGEVQYYLGKAYEAVGDKKNALKAFEMAAQYIGDPSTVKNDIARLKGVTAT